MPVAHGALNRVHSSPVSGIPQRGFLVHHATIGIVVDGSPDYEPHAAGSQTESLVGPGAGICPMKIVMPPARKPPLPPGRSPLRSPVTGQPRCFSLNDRDMVDGMETSTQEATAEAAAKVECMGTLGKILQH
jgi:hypothetical protein